MISGIRDRSPAAALLAGLLLMGSLLLTAGCQLVQIAQPLPPDRVNSTPIAVDAAMQARSWPPTPALYPNFSVTAGPSEMLLVPRADLKPAAHAALQTPVFLADLLLMPVVVVEGILPLPWAQVEATSLYLPPSYTTNAPLEPAGGNDYSGVPGIGWEPAPGRLVRMP